MADTFTMPVLPTTFQWVQGTTFRDRVGNSESQGFASSVKLQATSGGSGHTPPMVSLGYPIGEDSSSGANNLLEETAVREVP